MYFEEVPKDQSKIGEYECRRKTSYETVSYIPINLLYLKHFSTSVEVATCGKIISTPEEILVTYYVINLSLFEKKTLSYPCIT